VRRVTCRCSGPSAQNHDDHSTMTPISTSQVIAATQYCSPKEDRPARSEVLPRSISATFADCRTATRRLASWIFAVFEHSRVVAPDHVLRSPRKAYDDSAAAACAMRARPPEGPAPSSPAELARARRAISASSCRATSAGRARPGAAGRETAPAPHRAGRRPPPAEKETGSGSWPETNGASAPARSHPRRVRIRGPSFD